MSYAIMRLDSLLVLALFAFGYGQDVLERAELLMLFFVLSPTVRAGFDWAQLFYFDLKRLEIRVFHNLRQQFAARVERMSIPLGVVFWLFASGIGTLAFRGSLGTTYGLLLLFFICRSVLAAVQIRAFSEKSYRTLLGNGILFTVGVLSTSILVSDGSSKLLLFSAAALATAAILRVSFILRGYRFKDQGFLWFPEWLSHTSQEKGPVRIRVVRLRNREDYLTVGVDKRSEVNRNWHLNKLAERLARRLGGSGKVTLGTPDRLVWYERQDPKARIDRSWVTRQAGGQLYSLEETPFQPEGSSALAFAVRSGLFGTDLNSDSISCHQNVDKDKVKEEFERAFPSGIVYNPETPRPGPLQAFPSRQRRRILHDAVAFVRHLRPAKTAQSHEVTALSIAGEINLVFLVDRRTGTRQRKRWRNRIRQLNIQAAIAAGGGP
jgi:hypothetical protein